MAHRYEFSITILAALGERGRCIGRRWPDRLGPSLAERGTYAALGRGWGVLIGTVHGRGRGHGHGHGGVGTLLGRDQ